MREKPANEEALKKTILFLKRVQLDCLNNMQYGKGAQSLYELMAFFKISRRTAKACFELGILKADKEKKYLWNIGNANNGHVDYRLHALKILDHLLSKSKKTVHFPIPEFAGISQSLETIVERLAHLLSQNEKWLKSHKNWSEGNVTIDQADLFKIEEQKLLIATSIASGMYKTVSVCDHLFASVAVWDDGRHTSTAAKTKCTKCGYEPNAMEVETNDFKAINKFIVEATDDLYSQLLGRQTKLDEKALQFAEK